MVIIVYAAVAPERDVRASREFLVETAGESHYSYRVVLEQFLPVLETLGAVVFVEEPLDEVDAIHELCTALGEPCIFLSFAPPQLTPLGLTCRTVPVFAWEFGDIPLEAWSEDVRNDWRHVFESVGSAITHSRFAVDAVRRVMGDEFPIVSCPSPVWDGYGADAGRPLDGIEAVKPSRLAIPETAYVVDTGVQRPGAASGLSASVSVDVEELLSGGTSAVRRPPPLELDGVVYTSVFNPGDGRKRWELMVASFCRAFREVPDAVLVLKLVNWNHGFYLDRLHALLFKLAPFRCRVVAIGGFLDDETYDALVRASSYVLNTATGEGQCLPLMEFMSAGKPAIAPRHTAMVDYLDEDDGFLVDFIRNDAIFPQDERGKLRTSSFAFVPDSLVSALGESYDVAKNQPERYAALSRGAVSKLRAHCSRERARERLADFLAGAPVPS